MNQPHPLTAATLSPKIFERGLWALATAGSVFLFFFTSWLAMQRKEIAGAARLQRETEQKAQAALRDAWRDRAAAVNLITERLKKSEAARLAAEKSVRELASNTGNKTVAPQPAVEIAREKAGPLPAGIPDPTAPQLMAFVKAHLSRMTQAVEAQMADYAEEVDFHDKPQASHLMIESDRRQWSLRFPVRTIFKDEIQPRFTAIRDVQYGWVATAIFDWRWEYRSRTGAVLRGVTRDTWKIIPGVQGFQLISEHSADPATGVPKD
jgi:hypothetical protein